MLTSEGGPTYSWDGVHMMTKQDLGGTPQTEYAFLYTVGDERIAKIQVTNGTIVNATRTARGLDNKVLRTWKTIGSDVTNWTWEKDHVYRGSSLLASVDAEGTKHFHLDHLGTPRLITDENGEKVSFHTYYPFGEEATAQAQDAETMKFTGHERDLLTGNEGNQLDYMHARY